MLIEESFVTRRMVIAVLILVMTFVLTTERIIDGGEAIGIFLAVIGIYRETNKNKKE